MQKGLLCLCVVLIISGCRKKEEETSLPTAESLYEAAREITQDGYMHIVLFKTHKGDVPRALVTGHGYMERASALWFDFYYENGQWQGGPIDDIGGIWANDTEFYTLTEKNQDPKFIIIRVRYDFLRFDPETENTADQEAYHVTVDDNGKLKLTPIPEFALTDVKFYQMDIGPETEFPRIKLKSPRDKLERVKVHTFLSGGLPMEVFENSYRGYHEVYLRAGENHIPLRETTQPRWFYKDTRDNSVEALSILDWDKNIFTCEPFDIQEFDDLLKRGIIK